MAVVVLTKEELRKEKEGRTERVEWESQFLLMRRRFFRAAAINPVVGGVLGERMCARVWHCAIYRCACRAGLPA